MSTEDVWASTANDRLKAQWETLLAWSTVFAVLAHLAAFAFWPSWMLPGPTAEMAFEPDPIEWITLRDLASSGVGEAVTVAAPMGVGQESPTAEADETTGSVLGSTETSIPSDELLDRLRQSSFLRPTLAEPAYQPLEAEVTDGPDNDDTTDDDEALVIGGEAATASLESLPDPEALDLDRLSALQPKLSLTSLSARVLVRNPQQVVDYMQRLSRQGDVRADLRGTVSVTLWIDRSGSVEWSELKESSGDQRMDELVLELFNEVVSFRPAREEGVPVARSVVFIIAFPWI